MTDRSSDDKPLKPYAVFRDVDGSETLSRFDTLEDAQAFIGKHRRRGDWRFVVRLRRKIVWPENRVGRD